MRKKDTVVGLLMVVLLISTVGFYALYNQGTHYILELKEQIGAGDGEKPDIGAMITFTVIKEDGTQIEVLKVHNAMTALGLDYICSQVSGTQSTDMDYIAIGSGTGGTTALNTEEFRAQGTYTKGSTGVFTIDYTWVATTFDGEIITEAGVLNQGSGGVLFNYQTFSGITLTATDSLAVEFEFTFS